MTQTKVEAPFVENNLPFRNKVINGDFQVFQRATAATTAAQNTYNTTDRWKFQVSNDGAFTTEKETLSLADQATTGSATAFEIKCTSTDSSIGSGQYALISQDIEAQYLQDLLYGTSSAKDITVSFWCKSNLTGTFSLFLIKMDNTAYYIPTEFSLSSADTWEKKIITITPTQGSTSFITGSAAIINNDNGHGIQLGIALAAGSNLQGTNNTWTTSSAYTTSNQVNFLSSTDNNFYLTNVQLEVGSTATDFEHLPYDVQFHRCQRYCQQHTSASGDYYGYGLGQGVNTNINMCHMQLSPDMRVASTLETSSTAGDFAIYSGTTGVDDCTSLPSINGTGDTGSGGVRVQFTSTSNVTAGKAHENISNNAATFIRFTAEL